MKKFSLIFLALGSLLFADSFNVNQNKDNYNIIINSKDLVVGSNNIDIVLKNSDIIQDNLKVKFKIFMPEMPGMMAMEQEENAIFSDGKYKLSINFPMGGTWQYQLKFKNDKNEITTYKNNINVN